MLFYIIWIKNKKPKKKSRYRKKHQTKKKEKEKAKLDFQSCSFISIFCFDALYHFATEGEQQNEFFIYFLFVKTHLNEKNINRI